MSYKDNLVTKAGLLMRSPNIKTLKLKTRCIDSAIGGHCILTAVVLLTQRWLVKGQLAGNIRCQCDENLLQSALIHY